MKVYKMEVIFGEPLTEIRILLLEPVQIIERNEPVPNLSEPHDEPRVVGRWEFLEQSHFTSRKRGIAWGSRRIQEMGDAASYEGHSEDEA